MVVTPIPVVLLAGRRDFSFKRLRSERDKEMGGRMLVFIGPGILLKKTFQPFPFPLSHFHLLA
ncbi:MAG: hypothetical protein DI535_02350 [Citrobacter freundii]|nr:MAG: hypothetical protein DI535_02350 [Citrobacter freundii]